MMPAIISVRLVITNIRKTNPSIAKFVGKRDILCICAKHQTLRNVHGISFYFLRG